jgi:hypothetical protein
VSQLGVVVELEKRCVALLSVFIVACVCCTCVSSWCGSPVRWVDAAMREAWAWWSALWKLLCPIEDRGEAAGGLSSGVVSRVQMGDGCVVYVRGLSFTVFR